MSRRAALARLGLGTAVAYTAPALFSLAKADSESADVATPPWIRPTKPTRPTKPPKPTKPTKPDKD